MLRLQVPTRQQGQGHLAYVVLHQGETFSERMRRDLDKTLSDITTLADPGVVERMISMRG